MRTVLSHVVEHICTLLSFVPYPISVSGSAVYAVYLSDAHRDQW